MSRVRAIDEFPAPAEPARYLWSFPGSPIQVHVDLDVVRRIQARLTEGGSQSAWGLLVGSVSGQVTAISGFETLAKGDTTEIERAMAALEKAAGGREVVGYYRTHGEGSLRLSEADLSLARTYFRNPHHVILLIQTVESGPANASFFFWDGGRITGDFSFMEFPFDASLLENTERRRVEAIEQRASSIQAGNDPAPPPVPRKRAFGRMVKSAALVLLGASLAVAAVSVVRLFRNY